MSGGTINGNVTVKGEVWAGGKAVMWTDSEGGNLRLYAPDNTRWEIDAFNGNLRIIKYDPVVGFTFDKNGTFSVSKDIYASGIYASWGVQVPLNTAGLMFNNQGRIWSPSGQHLYFRASPEPRTYLHYGVHDSMWTFDPDVNNVCALGTANHRWTQLYVVAGSINTSDIKVKKDITNIPTIYEEVFFKLRPSIYRFKDGTSGRLHTGFIAQDAESALEDCNLTTMDWAAVCKDKNETGDDYVYGLRYEEIIALNTHMIQKLYMEINELKSKLF